MQGKTVNLAARNDIENLAGLLKGDKVALSAGRDVNLKASTQSNASGGVSSTRVDGVARIDAGDLNVQAGRDVNAQAAGIAATGDARIQAGNDINLTTEQERYAESYDYGKKNRSEMRSATEVGSRIVAGGNLTLIAGQDVNARAAEVTSDKQLAVGADATSMSSPAPTAITPTARPITRSAGSCRARANTARPSRTGQHRLPRLSRATVQC